MKYTAKSFTLPASGNWTSQLNWDRAFLSEVDFLTKYGVLPTCPEILDINSGTSEGVGK